MGIVDEDKFLTEEELKEYYRLLKRYGFAPHHFVLEITEDQTPMDMNDINYVVILKIQATHTQSKKSRIYENRARSGTWLTEFEEDLNNAYFSESNRVV